MNRIDLVNHFGSVTKVAEMAEYTLITFSAKVGYRIPKHRAMNIAKNSGLEFKESDYMERGIISDGVLYKSRTDINTVHVFNKALESEKGLHFHMFGHFIPVEVAREQGKDAFMNAFKSYELFQKVESPN